MTVRERVCASRIIEQVRASPKMASEMGIKTSMQVLPHNRTECKGDKNERLSE